MKRKKSRIWIFVVMTLLLVSVCGVSAYLLYEGKLTQEKLEGDLKVKEEYIQSKQKFLYVTTQVIHKGDALIEGENIEKQQCLTTLPDFMYLDDEYFAESAASSVAIIDIDENTPVFKTMVTNGTITADLREVEIGVAKLMLNQSLNDYVDIRIRFATGADYIVCSKLRVKAYDLKNSIFYTDLNESEILTLASATVDAYTNTGTKIYLTRYEEPTLQEDGIPTYPVNEVVNQLILDDPNVIETAERVLNLENRKELGYFLGECSEEYLEAVSDGDKLTDTAHDTAFAAQENYLNSDYDVEAEFIDTDEKESIFEEAERVAETNPLNDEDSGSVATDTDNENNDEDLEE